ncbi:ABC transporter permease [Spirosoma utsteinense]|uniref:ABC transport system permease protein n=1 Tax=Spirosoma utsteinense TaxID=2585773 RepID=A0ABR6W354_9BACT|nr:FtsX-like permease family protein [Spirosoma utsteinense]MBC3786652.1 putative ABC transport system permease protein [Spirosoma utsteinense]MBC3791015.1 putative ABC transport system permease protein [Spirosoma utsteinense]
MISHLFKLIWNKKKAHALLIIEIWASFMVLFGLLSLIVFNIRNYSQPLGFTYENVWAIGLQSNQDTVGIPQKAQRIFQRLKAYPEVASVSRASNNFPFSSSNMNTRVDHEKRHTMVEYYIVDAHFSNTLEMPLVAGRWYRGADSVGKFKPIVINQKASEELFENENPLGKIISKDKQVIGVVGNFKGKGEFMSNQPALFEQLDENNDWNKTMLVRVKPGTDAMFEAKVVKDLSAMQAGWSVEVDHLTDSRKTQHNLTLVPVIIALIVSGFLLVNVALGLFGILNLSIARRRGEIGLRRALGATGRGISTQFIGEIWVLATFALLIGLLFAVQFPLLDVFDLQRGIYVTAMLIAVGIIYGIVTLCALFPSRQAAMIQPAVALHEE